MKRNKMIETINIEQIKEKLDKFTLLHEMKFNYVATSGSMCDLRIRQVITYMLKKVYEIEYKEVGAIMNIKNSTLYKYVGEVQKELDMRNKGTHQMFDQLLEIMEA